MPTGSWQRLSGPCPIGGLAGCPKLFALIRRLEKEETGDDSEERKHCLCHRVQRDTCDGTYSDVFCEILAQDKTTPREKYGEVWHHARPGSQAVNMIGVVRLLARYSNLRFSAKWLPFTRDRSLAPTFPGTVCIGTPTTTCRTFRTSVSTSVPTMKVPQLHPQTSEHSVDLPLRHVPGSRKLLRPTLIREQGAFQVWHRGNVALQVGFFLADPNDRITT